MISEHFSRREFTLSQTAVRAGLANEPSGPQWVIIAGLVREVLEPARRIFGGPLRVSSGYRSPELNVAIGGSERSDHQVLGTAAAADLVVPQLGDLFRVLYWLPWSKLIWEYGRWAHVSWDAHGPPPGRVPWIKTRTRSYENLTYEEMAALGKEAAA